MSVSARRTTIISLIVAVALFGAAFFFTRSAPSVSPTAQNAYRTAEIRIKNAVVRVEIAETAAQTTKGLGGRDSLPDGEGMWFVFGAPARWRIWMKDMKFALDIVWFDGNLKIVSIAERVGPETYPKSFEPTSEASFVLEVPSGFVEKYSLGVGDEAFLR